MAQLCICINYYSVQITIGTNVRATECPREKAQQNFTQLHKDHPTNDAQQETKLK